jgi:hypothetical protein
LASITRNKFNEYFVMHSIVCVSYGVLVAVVVVGEVVWDVVSEVVWLEVTDVVTEVEPVVVALVVGVVTAQS